jgi:hypothetical protein
MESSCVSPEVVRMPLTPRATRVVVTAAAILVGKKHHESLFSDEYGYCWFLLCTARIRCRGRQFARIAFIVLLLG